MEQVREVLSKGSSMEQLQSELTVLGRDQRQSILESVLGRGKAISIPADEVLAMKADLSITWSKLRVMRRYSTGSESTHNYNGTHTLRWMKEWNVSFASECKERSLAKELVGPNLSAENVILTFAPDGPAEVMREAPFAYIPDLRSKVVQLLDQNDK